MGARQKLFRVPRVLLLVLLAVLCGGASLLSIKQGAADTLIVQGRLLLVGASLAGLLALALLRFHTWKLSRRLIAPFWLWLGFGYSVLIASMLKASSDLFVDGLWFLVCVPLICFVALPDLLEQDADILLALALCLGHLPYLLASLIFEPVGVHLVYSFGLSYKGIFYHFNGLGSTSLVVGTGVFILLRAVLIKRPARYRILVAFLITLQLLCLTLIIVSTSRTSLLAFMMVAAVFVWMSGIPVPRLLGLGIAMLVAASSSLLLMGEHAHALWEALARKMVHSHSSQGQLLSGREEIWGRVVQEATLIGHSSNYGSDGPGFHSSFIHILAFYGIIATLFMIGFAATSIWYAYRYSVRFAHEPGGLSPVAITMCFWVLSLAEGVFGSLGRGITMAFLISTGVVIMRMSQETGDVSGI
jgi:hypothetical protein